MSERFCITCANTGHVCENHPDRPWQPIANVEGSCRCGPGMPCPRCCDPIPDDGLPHLITEAFVPRHLRPVQ